MEDNLIRNINLEFPCAGEVKRFQLELDLHEYSQKAMWIYFNKGQLYEPETSRLFVSLLRPGDNVIDIGGHIGYFSLLAAAIIGQQGKVLAFEPEAGNFRHLLANCERNRFNNIQVIHKAVGDTEGEVRFYINADNDGGHAMWDVSTHEFNEKSRQQLETRYIPQTTLAKTLQEHPLTSLRLIKMDIEGSELKALKGAGSLLQDYDLPFVICEINRFAMKQMGCSEMELRTHMTSLGYDVFYPEEDKVTQLNDNQYIESEYVFNLLFAKPGRL